jgi:excisionase family DNA binding protein
LTVLPLPAGSVRQAGGCIQPVLLRGRVDHIDGATGELLHRYSTVHEPGGVLPVARKTRRASRCPPCAEANLPAAPASLACRCHQIRRPTTRTARGRPAMTRLLLTVPEAAEALAISRSKLYQLIASGAVDSILIGGSRRIPLAALEEYISRLLAERTAA